MTRLSIAFLATAALAFAATAQATDWVAGVQYSILPQAQRTQVAPGKVEVLEVFSYGCPHCDQFRATMKKLKAALPPNAQVAYLPAGWAPQENWPTLQRAFITAQSLGVAEKAHDAMFDAIWKTGELAIMDLGTQRLKPQAAMPKIEDMARFYQRVTGVKAADFVAASKSFGVDLKIRQADSQIRAMQVTGTPTLVVNGKYRVNNENLKTNDAIIELVKYLVAKESAPAPAKK
ncbi:MAG TPA: thiol:disulfide interchange protein DsbA/DsbL [Steroidobacteraceae bacterium]|jgi:thiol:disulfide interchange protein DsbA|nr:thiol:disulfide interchange protein DsbA/DsbL [Steroidobacteraceae bacterium]